MASTTYYVDARSTAGGTGLSPALTGANRAFTLPSAAVTAAKAIAPTGTTFGLGHTIHIANGVYEDPTTCLDLTHANLSGMVVIGESMAGVHLKPAKTGSNRGILTSSLSCNITLKKITVYTGVLEAFRPQSGWIGNEFTDVAFVQTTESVLAVNLGGQCVLNNCVVYGDARLSSTLIQMTTPNGDFTFNNLQVLPVNDSARAGSIILNSSGGVLRFNNSSILYTINSPINVTLGTCYVNGSIIAGVEEGVKRTGGALHVSNSWIKPGIVSTSTYQYSATEGSLSTDTDNIKDCRYPHLITQRRGSISVCVDDSPNVEYAIYLANLFKVHGYKVTWFADQSRFESQMLLDPTLLPRIKALIASGDMEVGCHGFSHSRLDYIYALRISNIGGTNPAVSLDSSNVLSLTCNEPEYSFSVDTTGMQLSDIISSTNGIKGWSVGKSTSGGQDATRISDRVKSSSLARIASTPAPCDILYDISGYDSGFFRDEINQTRLFFNTLFSDTIDGRTGATYNCSSFAFNYDFSSSASIAAVKASGYSCARTVTNPGNPGNTIIWDVFSFGDFQLWNISGQAENDIRIIARTLATEAKYFGITHFPLAHTTTEVSYAVWGYILDEWRNLTALNVISMSSAASMLTENGETSDGSTYSNPEPLSNLHLQPTSPCIGAGTAITGITTDAEGNQLYPPYNIGPYGAATGALEQSTSDYTGRSKYNIAADSDWNNATMPDCNEARLATGWTYGNANWAYNADGTAKTVSKAALEENGAGLRFYFGPKGGALYSVDQTANDVKIKKTLGVSLQ